MDNYKFLSAVLATIAVGTGACLAAEMDYSKQLEQEVDTWGKKVERMNKKEQNNVKITTRYI